MSLLEERPIHRLREPKYVMELYIYPVARCGSDLQKGSPIEVSAESIHLYELKRKTEEMILSAMSAEGYDGECFVEIRVTENGDYCESDEIWADVCLVNKTVKTKGGCI